MARIGSDKKSKMLVAAIDIGTTHSGYAFSFKQDYEKDQGKISVNCHWFGCSAPTLKAPTVVLFNKNQEFMSFGYEAEDRYYDDDHEHEQFYMYLFKRFKMYRHDQKIYCGLKVQDIKGRTMSGTKVFGAVIEYLKDHLLSALEQRGTPVDIADIHWILTVPAIWADSAKSFMTVSANMAKIDASNLSIALESEAAWLYCQLISTDRIHASEGSTFEAARPRSKFMVIDLGGVTANITVYERQADGSLKALHKASGGAWGGTKVDEEFYQMLINIIGAPTFIKFTDTCTADYLDLQRDLEVKKRIITPNTKGKVTLKVPVSLKETYQTDCLETVDKAINESPLKGKIAWLPDKLRIDAEIFKRLFKSCSDKVVAHILSLLKFSECKDTNTFFLVGGFSESEMMQDAIIKALPNRNVVIPDEAGLSILKGAVIFGYRPVAITSRVFRYTYGINISPPFDPEVHSEDRRVRIGGIDRCRDVFKKYVQVGDKIGIGESRFGKHIPLFAHQREIELHIFASPKREPLYVDEEDCECLGCVTVQLPFSEERNKVEVTLTLSETGMAVEAHDLSTLQKFSSFFDFL